MYPSQQNSADHTSNFFWLLIIICLAFLAVWYFHPEWVVRPIFWMRLGELNGMLYLIKGWNHLVGWLQFLSLPKISSHELLYLKQFIVTADPKHIEFSQFSSVNTVMGRWMRWPAIALLVCLSVISFSRHSTMLFRQRHDMNSLKLGEAENWPQIQPILSLDLVKEDLEKGPWAMAKTPLDYCRGHKILKDIAKNGVTVWTIDKGPAYRLLAMQLGPLWKDLFNLPIHVKALVVIFVARAERDRAVAKKFLSQIAMSAGSGKLDFTGVTEQLIQYRNSKLLQWMRPRHAYVRTMMASLLEVARADGVLATSEFLWLKPVDRKLWYTLNSVGRQTAVVEVAGVFAHWKAEKTLGRAMTTPMVKEAVTALQNSVEDILYVGEGDRWRSNEA